MLGPVCLGLYCVWAGAYWCKFLFQWEPASKVAFENWERLEYKHYSDKGKYLGSYTWNDSVEAGFTLWRRDHLKRILSKPWGRIVRRTDFIDVLRETAPPTHALPIRAISKIGSAVQRLRAAISPMWLFGLPLRPRQIGECGRTWDGSTIIEISTPYSKYQSYYKPSKIVPEQSVKTL